MLRILRVFVDPTGRINAACSVKLTSMAAFSCLPLEAEYERVAQLDTYLFYSFFLSFSVRFIIFQDYTKTTELISNKPAGGMGPEKNPMLERMQIF